MITASKAWREKFKPSQWVIESETAGMVVLKRSRRNPANPGTGGNSFDYIDEFRVINKDRRRHGIRRKAL